MVKARLLQELRKAQEIADKSSAKAFGYLEQAVAEFLNVAVDKDDKGDEG